jgi:hypothetical protein
MGNDSGKTTIPPKMLHKICATNMNTMTKASTLTARARRKSLTTCKLKELGSYAEHEAMERYTAEVATQNAMDHEPPPNIGDNGHEVEPRLRSMPKWLQKDRWTKNSLPRKRILI